MIWMRPETWCDSGKMRNSMQCRPFEVQQALNRREGLNLMQWLGLQARLTLTITCTLRNCHFLTRAFVTICSSCTLGIGLWRKLDIVCSWFATILWRSRYAVGGSLRVTDQASEQRLEFRFYLFELSWWKSVHTIYSKIRFFLAAQTYKLVKM